VRLARSSSSRSRGADGHDHGSRSRTVTARGARVSGPAWKRRDTARGVEWSGVDGPGPGGMMTALKPGKMITFLQEHVLASRRVRFHL
jgi:hypothetical protein